MKRGKLFKIVWTLLLIITAKLSTFAQEKNRWPASPVNINGVSNEWSRPLKYNSAAKLSFAIANDEHNLYFLIESADQPTNVKILSNSMTISINSKGSKRPLTSLTFPVIEPQYLSGKRLPFRASRDERPGSTGLNTRDDILAKATTIKIKGFSRIPDGTFSIHLMNTYGIKAAADLDQNKVLTYELSIPLSQLNMSSDQKKSVVYSIKINGSPDPLMNSFGSGDSDRGRIPGGTAGIPTGRGIPGIGTGGLPGMGGTIRFGGGQKPSRPGNSFGKDNINTKAVRFRVKYQLAQTKL